ncbi:hypothetical protein [Arcticibacter svalbardensis]|nr:hypothetical protein [Arcticibacter svalbardensis]
MKNKYLFPHRFRSIGWIILIPSIALGLAIMLNEFQFTYLSFDNPLLPSSNVQLFNNNFTDEVAMLGMIVGLLFIGFSKEIIEDEQIAQIRLESLQWSIYFNYILLAVSVILIYGVAFLNVMIYNMFTILLFFIVRFRFILYRQRNFRMEEDAE